MADFSHMTPADWAALEAGQRLKQARFEEEKAERGASRRDTEWHEEMAYRRHEAELRRQHRRELGLV